MAFQSSHASPSPTALPRALTLPLQLLPATPVNRLAVLALNQIFAAALAAGELDFLHRRIVSLSALDLPRQIQLSAMHGCFDIPPVPRKPDLLIAATLDDYLRLMLREADPDTLFFQRRLRMQGDTELGLQVKNFLAGWEPAPHQQTALEYLRRGRDFITRHRR